MLFGRFTNRRIDSDPVLNRGNFTKGNPGLNHSKRAGIHAQKHNFRRGGGGHSQILFMGGPSIVQWIVNVLGGRTKVELIHLILEVDRSGNQSIGSIQAHNRQMIGVE